MQHSLTNKQSKMFLRKDRRSKIELLFEIRVELLQGYHNVSQLKQVSDMSSLMKNLITEDNITISIPSKKPKQTSNCRYKALRSYGQSW